MKGIRLLLLLVLLGTKAHAFCELSNTATVTATTTSALLLDRDNQRKCLVVQNTGSYSVYVKPNSAHSSTEGIEIPAGGNWEPPNVPHNPLYVLAASSTVPVKLLYGN